MDRFEEIKLESLQDSWVIMYTFVAKELYDKAGLEGESALREAVRRYGRDRGLTNRQRLLDNHIKINLETLFHEGRDRPGEPRFLSKVIRSTREERISDTLICSFADVWKRYGAKHLGRIYCEEFHIACYQAFGFGKTKVNLSRTLTQDGDDRCIFYHTYRPENLTDEERRLSFEEYDPGYVKPQKPMPKPEGKSGFNMLWIKMYFYLLETAVERLGETGKVLVEVSPDFYRPTDVVNLLGDPAKAKRELGWNPTKTSFEELVRRMVAHDMEQAAAERRNRL